MSTLSYQLSALTTSIVSYKTLGIYNDYSQLLTLGTYDVYRQLFTLGTYDVYRQLLTLGTYDVYRQLLTLGTYDVYRQLLTFGTYDVYRQLLTLGTYDVYRQSLTLGTYDVYRQLLTLGTYDVYRQLQLNTPAYTGAETCCSCSFNKKFSRNMPKLERKKGNFAAIIIIIIKTDQQCKAERGRLTPYQYEYHSPTLPAYRVKEDKGKIVEDKKGESNQANKKALDLLLKPANPTQSNMPKLERKKGNSAAICLSWRGRRVIHPRYAQVGEEEG